MVASTTTDANGMWEFTSLADSPHDIKITYLGNVWWHKGLTKHSVDAIFYTTPTPVTDNYLRNAGFEGGPAGPWTVTNIAQSVFGSWTAINGVGSSAAVSREPTIVPTDSSSSAKVVQTKVAGQFLMYQNFPVPASMRGKQLSISAQVRQSLANSVLVYITDGTTFATSTPIATTGSFVTMTINLTVASNAAAVQAGIYIDGSSTSYIDNVIWSLGAVAATYRPEYFSAYSLTNDLLATDAVDARVLAANSVGTSEIIDANVTAAKLAAGVAVANLGFTPVNKAGDSGVGDLALASTKTLAFAQENATKIKFTANGGYAATVVANTLELQSDQSIGLRSSAVGAGVYALHINASTNLVTFLGGALFGNGQNISFKDTGGTLRPGMTLWIDDKWYFGDGIKNTVLRGSSTVDINGTTVNVNGHDVTDALTLNGVANAALLARANHTGTQLAATISDRATALLARSQHTGTQAPTTISPQGSGSGLDADTVDGNEASTLLARANHTGTQLASTISDRATALLARSQHTGTQTASTLSDLATEILARSKHTGTQLAATISDLATAVAGMAAASATTATTATTANQLGGVVAANYMRKDVDTTFAGDRQFTMGGGTNTLTIGGNVSVFGNHSISGTKSRLLFDKKRDLSYLYANESPVPYFEDFGRAALEHGVVTVPIPDDFAQVVDLNDYHVFLQVEGEATLMVGARYPDRFVVLGLTGNPNAPFSWRLVARQFDQTDVERLGRAMSREDGVLSN